MRRMNYITLVMFLSYLSCEKSEKCNDMDLSLNRVGLTSSQLRLDGFYYGNPESDWENTVRYETFVFYQNGVLLRSGEILNDTTFVLNKIIRRDSQGVTKTDINQEFHFRQFDIRPDSTNNFIK